MILVVDSGSYKSDWMFTPAGSDPLTFRTKGLNPFFVPEKEMVKIVQQLDALSPYVSDIREIYFFGSGCTSPDRREIISNALSTIFKNTFISVDTDLIGSAYATCGDQPGFIAAIGTGSSVSYFDSQDVQPSKIGLGYVLGDIGSGTWFGKKLVTSFLYKTMPEELRIAFDQQFSVTKEVVIKQVYRHPTPNVYLASFAPFLSAHQEHPYIQQLLVSGFDEFIRTSISAYPGYQNSICHFVGSIAYFFSDELKKVCEARNVRVGKVIRQPIQHLYHYVIEREGVTE